MEIYVRGRYHLIHVTRNVRSVPRTRKQFVLYQLVHGRVTGSALARLGVRALALFAKESNAIWERQTERNRVIAGEYPFYETVLEERTQRDALVDSTQLLIILISTQHGSITDVGMYFLSDTAINIVGSDIMPLESCRVVIGSERGSRVAADFRGNPRTRRTTSPRSWTESHRAVTVAGRPLTISHLLVAGAHVFERRVSKKYSTDWFVTRKCNPPICAFFE